MRFHIKIKNKMKTVLTAISIIACLMAQAQYVITPVAGKSPLIIHGVPQGEGEPLVLSGDTVKVGSPITYTPATFTYIFAGDIKQDERCLITNGHADEQCRDCNWLETKAYIPDTCILSRIWWICEDWQQVNPPNFYLINNGIPILFGITGTSGTITSYPFVFTIYPGTLQWKFVEGTKTNKSIFWIELYK